MAQAHPFLYSAPRRDFKRLLNIAIPRDIEANAHLRIGLNELGYDFGESVLNFPSAQPCYDLLPEELLTRVDLPFATSGDILVCSTRPPMSDGVHGDMKKVEPSNTTVERHILRHCRRYFRTIARSYLELTSAAARFLPEDMKDRAGMTFFQHSSDYMYLDTLEGERSTRRPYGNLTPAFVLNVAELWKGGPGLRIAWGVNAIVTLAWCVQLRYRCPWMLESPGLTMVELEPTVMPERPTTYAWARDWRVTPVFSTDGELPPSPEENDLPCLPISSFEKFGAGIEAPLR